MSNNDLVMLIANKLPRDLKPHEYVLLLRLAAYRDSRGDVHLPYRALRYVAGLKSSSGASSAVGRLVELGLVERFSQPGNGNMNRYRIHIDAVKALPNLPVSPEADR